MDIQNTTNQKLLMKFMRLQANTEKNIPLVVLAGKEYGTAHLEIGQQKELDFEESGNCRKF